MAAKLAKKNQDVPLKTAENAQDQINRLFDLSFGRSGWGETLHMPPVDISEDRDNVYIEANMPGMDQKNISLSMNNGALQIMARREEFKEENKKNYYRSERMQGSMYREVPLPPNVDQANIKAAYKNGVLKVTMPKREEAKAKEIKVASE